MTTAASPTSRWTASLPLLLACALAGPPARASAQAPQPDWGRDPVLPPDLRLTLSATPPGPDSRPQRIRLFRIQPGFLSEPVGLDLDEVGEARPAEADPGPDWISVSAGTDNPYFELRQRGDPGGLGFFRANAQVQLFDSKTTACALALQAVTPAGQEYAGLPDNQGPTVVSPALSLFHALDERLALQGFVGKHVLVTPGGACPVHKDLQCGMALQSPLAPDGPEALRTFYLSLGALGRVRVGGGEPDRKPVVLDVLPGFHWKLAENWWVSGGVLLPVAPRLDPGQLWQVTCSLQF